MAIKINYSKIFFMRKQKKSTLPPKGFKPLDESELSEDWY